MLESKKPSHLIKKLQSNEVEFKVNFLDETVHTFSVKVSAISMHIKKKIDNLIDIQSIKKKSK